MEFTDYGLTSPPLCPYPYRNQEDAWSYGPISRGGVLPVSSFGKGAYTSDSAYLARSNRAPSPMFQSMSRRDDAGIFHGDGPQSMGRVDDGDNGALVPQDPNVEKNLLSGNISVTQAPMTSHPIPVFNDAIPANEGSVVGVNAKRSLTCSICRKVFSRRSRAEACENMHQHKRPYACRNACGTSDCSASFPSKAALSRHSRGVETRNKACTRCGKDILRQNIARHEKLCHGRVSLA